MFRAPDGFDFLLLLLPCLINGIKFEQSPHLTAKSGEEAEIRCSHDDSSYLLMYWYRQGGDSSALDLIGFGYNTGNPTYEGQFHTRFKLSRTAVERGALTISNLTGTDSAVYFCAARMHRAPTNYEAYFGEGTKLTVLEPGIEITPPNVKVLPPSGQELCKTKSVTLVCVATRFYPDHINVIWQLNGKDAKNYVTDNRALWDDNNKTYSITSRLKVLSKQWFNTKNKFTCLTSFYNGEKNLENQDTIQGVEGGGMNIEYIKKSGLTAKLSYGVLLFKSFGYGLFVFAVVWKLRGSAKKRNN